MKEIGLILKQTRESQGKSLEEISTLTKIQLPTLVAMENGDFGRMTNKAFIKGFIRQYAKALGLNADQLISSLGETTPQLAADVKPTPVSKLDSNELTNKTNLLWFRTPSQFITLGAVVIILMLITFIYFISMKMMSYSQETVQKDTAVTSEVENPLEDEAKIEEATLPEKTPEGKEEAATPKETPAKPSAAATESQPAAVTEAQDTEESEPPPKGVAAVSESTQKMVAVEARANVNVVAEWSTGKSETIQLNANNRHVFYYLDKIRITVDDGGSVKITTHEKSLGIPGEKSKPITINFR